MKKDTSTNKLDKLRYEKISKLVFSYFMTTFAGLMLNSVYNLTDTLFVSWGVGDIAMGGVSIVFPFVIIQGALSTTIGSGAASLISRKLGEGRSNEAGKITINAMVVFYIISIIITIIGFVFMDQLLELMGATDELLPDAKSYFTIILASNIFSTGFSAIIRAEGKMLYAMLIWVVPITVNIILDALFIMVFGWGVKGSAIATLISQVITFLMCIIFFTKFSTQKYKNAKLQFQTIKSIIKIGIPSLVQMGSLSIITAILNIVLSKISGTSGVVVYSYMSKIITYAIAPFLAITHALAPIVGFNYGINNKERVKETISFCLKISILYAIIIILVAEIIPQYLLMIFTRNAEIINIGSNGLRIIAISILFMPLPMIIGAKMQATGKTLWALIIYSSNMFFIILPVIYLGNSFGAVGVWWAYVIAGFCSSLIVIVKLLFDMIRNKKTKISETEALKD